MIKFLRKSARGLGTAEGPQWVQGPGQSPGGGPGGWGGGVGSPPAKMNLRQLKGI